MTGGGIGGRFDENGHFKMYTKYTKTSKLYEIETDSWSAGPDMNVGRTNPATCVMQGRWLYVFCGFGENSELGSVERLDALTFV